MCKPLMAIETGDAQNSAVRKLVEEYLCHPTNSPEANELIIRQYFDNQHPGETVLECLKDSEFMAPIMPTTQDIVTYDDCKKCGEKGVTIEGELMKGPFMPMRNPGPNDTIETMLKELILRIYLVDCRNEKCTGQVRKTVQMRFKGEPLGFIAQINRIYCKKKIDRETGKPIYTQVSQLSSVVQKTV